MATDDERRRVAERMRASAGKYNFCAFNIALDMGIVGSDYGEGYNAHHRLAWLRLADLIEPAPKCSEAAPKCDREALLALADEFESGARDARAHKWNEPANAVMAIALADEYEANARRIREACGEAR